MGRRLPLNHFDFFWKLNAFIDDTLEVLGCVLFCVAVGTLASREPLKVSDGLDVSGCLDNSHRIKAWTIPIHTLGSYEHSALIGRVSLNATVEKAHGIGTKEVTATIPAIRFDVAHCPVVGHSIGHG